jgi:hypothetical protein
MQLTLSHSSKVSEFGTVIVNDVSCAVYHGETVKETSKSTSSTFC